MKRNPLDDKWIKRSDLRNMAEVNSFEFSLPECVLTDIHKMDSDGGSRFLAWEGEILQVKETVRSSGRRRRMQKRPETNLESVNNKVQILAEKKHDGMLQLTIDRLNMKIVEKKFCCVISSAKLTCAGDAGGKVMNKSVAAELKVPINDPETSTGTKAFGINESELAYPVVEGDHEDEMNDRISCKTITTPAEIADGDGFHTCQIESNIGENVMAYQVSQSTTPIEDSHIPHSPSAAGEANCGLGPTLDSETNQQLTDIVVGEKRKRGRPRKHKYIPTDSHDGISTKKADVSVLPVSQTFDNKTTTKGGYCLRGAKLRKDLMAAEKGNSDADSDEDGNVTEHPSSQNLPNDSPECPVYEDSDNDNLEHDSPNSLKAEKYSDKCYESRTMDTNGVQISTSRCDRDHGGNEFGDLPKSKRRQRNNIKVAKCKYCDKMFCDFTGVSDHAKKFHTGEAELRGYMKELQQLQVMTCKVCDMKFKSRYNLHSHENRVHGSLSGEVSMTCSTCQKSFKSLLSLRDHVKYVHHRKNKEHLCHLCPAKFKWSNTLKQHVEEIHVGSKAFSCETCGKGFSRRAQLNRHVRIHGADMSKRICCPVCGKGFWFEANMQRHIRAIHTPQVESFHCSYCGKGFCQRGSMLAHVQLTHFHLFPFSCKICTAGFSRSKLLENHMRTAHGDKNFKHSDPRRQRFKYNKSPDDLFYCSYCSSSFFYKAKMIEHMHKTHSKDFPFICETCDQGFLLKKFLSTHKYSAHGEPKSGSDCEANEDGDPNSLKNGPPNKHSALSDNSNNVATAVIGIDQRESNENEQMETSGFEHDLEMSNTEAAASLLVEVASGNVTTHYIIQSKDQLEYQDTSPAVMAHDIASLFLAAESSMQALSTDQDHMAEIVTTEGHEPTQVLVPSHLGEGSFEVVETFEETSVPHHSENVTIELEHLDARVVSSGSELQIEDAITGNVCASIVVTSEPNSC